MKFKNLSLSDWRQFEKINLEFHPRLTILTGANGSGKTSLLSILGRHYQWDIPFVGTPWRNRSTPSTNYRLERIRLLNSETGGREVIGQLVYDSGETSEITAPPQGGQQYHLEYSAMRQVRGLHIPSHRPMQSYKVVPTIPTEGITMQRAYSEYYGSAYSQYQGNHTQKSPMQVMKEALMSFALFGKGNEFVVPDEAAFAAFVGFQEVLRNVLPSKLGFRKLQINAPDVLLETDTGTFPLDAVSGGVSSIIDIAWRIFMKARDGEEFVCTIDEPENHLHPELQQSLLPSLIRTFPDVQFIVATHSPFMISAVYDSAVFVLDYNPGRRVQSEQLDAVNKAGTANEILREVLGLPFTMPLWAEEKMGEIVAKYSELGVDESNITAIESEIREAGLGSLLPGKPKSQVPND